MIIAIAGGTGSGKSTLAQQVATYFKTSYNLNVASISMDNYYKNIHETPFDNYDHPDAFDLQTLYSDLQNFQKNREVSIRSYDYNTKEKKIIGVIKDVDILIIEGLYAFYHQTSQPFSHYKVYLDVDQDKRVQRRLKRDLHERNISHEENLEMFDDFVHEMHERYVSKQSETADFVVVETPDITTLIDALYKRYQNKLSEED